MNKGQVLVGLVLMIPIMFILCFTTYELVELNNTKKEITKVVVDAISSSLDSDEPYSKALKLIDKNISCDDLKIEVDQKSIKVEVYKKTKIKDLKIKYRGYFEDNRIVKE